MMQYTEVSQAGEIPTCLWFSGFFFFLKFGVFQRPILCLTYGQVSLTFAIVMTSSIFIYLPHTTHALQPLDVAKDGSQSHFFHENELHGYEEGIL